MRLRVAQYDIFSILRDLSQTIQRERGTQHWRARGSAYHDEICELGTQTDGPGSISHCHHSARRLDNLQTGVASLDFRIANDTRRQRRGGDGSCVQSEQSRNFALLRRQ